MNITPGPIIPWRIQVDLDCDAEGVPVFAKPQVFYEQKITIDGDPLIKDHGQISWDSIAKKDEPVAIKLSDGTIAETTRGGILAAVLAIGETERTAQQPPQEP